MKQPYFSVIIPCYNPRKYISDLLNSIIDQNMDKDDIEVIIADDHSTEPYSDILNKFCDRLLIRFVQTPYNFAPGNTREAGAQVATGKWMTFADQDDTFYPDTFKAIKENLELCHEEYFCFTTFDEVDPLNENEIRRRFEGSMSWTHGKFYNRENFWLRFDVHYKHDLKTHEDIYLCTTTTCILKNLGVNPLYIRLPVYKWRAWPESVSRSMYATEFDEEQHDFLELHLDDYLYVTGGVYLEKFKEGIIDKDFTMFNCMEVLLYAYFYFCAFIYRMPDKYLKRNIEVLNNYIKQVGEELGVNSDEMLKYIMGDPIEYCKIRDQAADNVGYYIPMLTFEEFMKKIGG